MAKATIDEGVAFVETDLTAEEFLEKLKTDPQSLIDAGIDPDVIAELKNVDLLDAGAIGSNDRKGVDEYFDAIVAFSRKFIDAAAESNSFGETMSKVAKPVMNVLRAANKRMATRAADCMDFILPVQDRLSALHIASTSEFQEWFKSQPEQFIETFARASMGHVINLMVSYLRIEAPDLSPILSASFDISKINKNGEPSESIKNISRIQMLMELLEPTVNLEEVSVRKAWDDIKAGVELEKKLFEKREELAILSRNGEDAPKELMQEIGELFVKNQNSNVNFTDLLKKVRPTTAPVDPIVRELTGYTDTDEVRSMLNRAIGKDYGISLK